MVRLGSIYLLAFGSAWVSAFTTVREGRAAEPVKLTVVEAPPPKELAEPIRSALQQKALRLAERKEPFFEFWFRKEIPLANTPPAGAFAISAVKEGTVLGAVKVYQERYDFRDEEIPPGVYVMRFALQPEDGDHLGTSPTRTFVLLIPAKQDPKLAPRDYKELVEASSKVNAAEHPSNLNLQPVAKGQSDFPRLASHSGGDHKVVCVRLPARVEGQKQPARITFALVYEGVGRI